MKVARNKKTTEWLVPILKFMFGNQIIRDLTHSGLNI